MTNRLVVVSNRVPAPTGAGITPGGLVSALLPSLEATGSAVWFGWSGEIGTPQPRPRRVVSRGVEYVTIDLEERQVRDYYEEFGNRVLWPLLHGMTQHVAPGAAGSYATYREVNRQFARSLFPLLRPDDLVWVHDYHLIPLGAELRRLGWRGRTGYFHHTPVPTLEAWSQLRHGAALADAFGAYDLIGVQTERDRRNLGDILIEDDVAQRIAAYPISIDTERFREFTAAADAQLKQPALQVPDSALLYFGVERLDYTKGIPQRLEAFERALANCPAMLEGARFVQWAAPSRTSVPEYQAERDAVDEAARRLNERFDFEPLLIDFEPHPPGLVAPALEQADVCVVSSVADGMNLVAKEFAAVHSSENPGVLVISDMCGASEELTEALIYPSGDIEAMSKALQRAYFMPDRERRMRAASLREVVDQHTSRDWLREFVTDLREVLPRTKVIRPSPVSRREEPEHRTKAPSRAPLASR